MSDVIPLNTPKHPPHDNFNYEGSNVPGVICNIVVKADLGRSPGRRDPPVIEHRCLENWYTKLGR